MERYFSHGIMPGGFLTAVLENDLMESLGRADHMSVQQLPGIVSWLYNKAPMGHWGSVDNVKRHLEFIREQKEAEAKVES